MSSPAIGAGIRGTLLGGPLQALVWVEGGALSWSGRLEWKERGLDELLEGLLDPNLLRDDPTGLLKPVLDGWVGPVSASLSVASSPTRRSFELATDLLTVRALKSGSASALVLKLPAAPPASPGLDWIRRTLEEVKEALGLTQLFVAYRKGMGLGVAELTGDESLGDIPTPLGSYPWLAYAKFQFDKESVAARAFESLGVRELSLFLGMRPQTSEYLVCLAFPRSAFRDETSLLDVQELFLQVVIGGQEPRFQVTGSFALRSLAGLTFTAASTITRDSFDISASCTPSTPFSISAIPGFALVSGGLLIGAGLGGLTFGLTATVCVGTLMIFGALVIEVKGTVTVPTLVSGAIDPISVPTLVASLMGSNAAALDSAALSALDVIQLDGLQGFQLDAAIPEGLFQPKDAADAKQVAESFNASLPKALKPGMALDSGETLVFGQGGKLRLFDKTRLRHYLIDGEGRVFLQPQFYAASATATIGEFTANPGIFLCGAITVLGYGARALFSLSPVDGLLAYASLDPIDLKLGDLTVLQLAASTDPSPSPIQLGADDPFGSLLSAQPAGPTFFLSVSKRDVSFFVDGHLKLLGFLECDARAVYRSGSLSIHAELSVWGIRVILALDASYAALNDKTGFSFRLALDTTGLSDGLGAVTHRIDQAITALQQTMADAQAALDAAQANVDALRNQIQDLDDKIAACVQAIDAADWWAKPVVAVAKGAEIAAYEVAKAGIWAAIGVASAALALASAAIAVFGGLGTAVLSLVNATVRAATSLLFLRSAEVAATLLPGAQTFRAAIAFVALGKEYSFDAFLDFATVKDGLLKAISDGLIGKLQPDLDALAQGQAPALLAVRAARRVDEAAIPRINGAPGEIRRAASVLAFVQRRYRERFGEDYAGFTALNASFAAAMQTADNTLATARRSAASPGLDALPRAIRALDRSALPQAGRERIEGALGEADRAGELGRRVLAAANATASARHAVAQAASEKRPAPRARAEAVDQDQQMRAFLQEVEEEIRRVFPADVDTGYINLAMEPRVEDLLQAARGRLGVTVRAAPRVRVRRPATYRARL